MEKSEERVSSSIALAAGEHWRYFFIFLQKWTILFNVSKREDCSLSIVLGSYNRFKKYMHLEGRQVFCFMYPNDVAYHYGWIFGWLKQMAITINQAKLQKISAMQSSKFVAFASFHYWGLSWTMCEITSLKTTGMQVGFHVFFDPYFWRTAQSGISLIKIIN